MDPKVWGKQYWGFLFSTALGYPRNPDIDTQHNYFRHYFNLANVLPCESCQYNYENHLRKLPLNFHLHSRMALLNWVLMLHNEVNRTIGKPPITAVQAIQKYLNINLNEYPEVYNDCREVDRMVKSSGSETAHELVKVTGDNIYENFEDQNQNNDTAIENFNLKEISNTEIIIILATITLFYLYLRQ